MSPKINILKWNLLMVWCYLSCFSVSGQGDTSTFKAQIALGVNSPSNDGFVQNFKGKSVNFPTVNLGLQYMFTRHLGGKLDYGFSRISNETNSPEFKLNYSRVNLQAVYDASRVVSFSQRMGTFLHAGPGFSMVKPLGNYTNNDVSFLNVMGGVEFHYGISDSLTLFLDTSYILGMGSDFNPVSSGFGAFNGDLLTITFGASISLSGCYFCGD
ncbi:cell envelope biogenesis protein OmpA [Hyunsoonleella flava]|uniref:Cell envelope biogenesis protein OmpA n=1 Tax=Hyunsoonleella flava TaxID=2527939 RepID=A0A4Q9FFF1_9FLAO|nr:outer membrane beta-barrel protein [Hyunsoonleella flava]TBN05307.1 cell envelope biogenesis protein OmpA [Hyunsoonleella flava]